VFAWQAIAADEGRGTVVAYLPRAGEIRLRGLDDLAGDWLHPVTGERMAAATGATRTAPDWPDAVLVLRR